MPKLPTGTLSEQLFDGGRIVTPEGVKELVAELNAIGTGIVSDRADIAELQAKIIEFGLSFVSPVLDQTNTPPGTPSDGDRYIVTATAGGAWAGKETEIAEWDGSAWAFTSAEIGMVTWDVSEDEFFVWTGAAWSKESFHQHAIGDAAAHSGSTLALLNALVSDATLDDSGDPRDPNAHAASHVLSGADAVEGSPDFGSSARAAINIATNPTTADTLTIGSDVYEFRAAAANVTNDAYIAVEIGMDAATSRANLIAAVNATYSPNEHPSIFLADGSTPALANGTENLVAEGIGTEVVVVNADAPGGSELVGSHSIVLAENLTPAADIWDVGDVNMNTLAGTDELGLRKMSTAELDITTAMITHGSVGIRFPFAVGCVQITAQQASGKLVAGDDVFEVSGHDVLITLAGMGVDLDNGGKVMVTAYSA